MFGNVNFPGFASRMSIANHYVPLVGETYGGSVHDRRIEEMAFGHTIEMEAAYGSVQSTAPSEYRSHEVFQAAQMALGAHAYLPGRPADAEREARKALRISPVCPEALNVLALISGTNEKALELYRQAEEVGPQVVPPDRLELELASDDLWMRPPLRPYLRAIFGVGNTLRKLGRYREALEKYEQLCKQSSKMHSIGTFTNWFAHLPELWLRVHGPQECLKRMHRATNVRAECTEYNSSQVHWLYNMALAQFASGQVQEYKGSDPFKRRQDDPGVMWLTAWEGGAAVLATSHQPVAGGC